MASPIYMDNHATTRVDPRVVEAMLPYFGESYGNAASVTHAVGWAAKQAADEARESIARSIGAAAKEIYFTSGATESNNLALRGVADRPQRKGNHLVSVRTEHPSVLDPLSALARRGLEVTLLEPRRHPDPQAGLVAPEQVAQALRDDTLLVSIMLANNEIGVIQPLREIAAVCHRRGVLVHTDATQAVGKIPLDVRQTQVDLMSFTAHKIYGPKGIGALYVRRQVPKLRLEPQVLGGGHEGGLRSGTLNVPGIVGFAKALELCLAEMAEETPRLRALRDALWAGLRASIPGVALNGPDLALTELRLPGNLNVQFAGIEAEALLLSAPELAASSGSACTSANPEPSHVLLALGLAVEQARSSLRFGLGRFNTAEEVDRVVARLAEAAASLRAMSSFS